MNKPNEAVNTQSETIASEEQQPGSRAVVLLFNAATLAGAVVACAMSGPKIPPWAGD